jgi:putative Mg2+ transporter-C (MgtC) family protein
VRYLVGDWWDLLGTPVAPVVLALVAVACGAVVGAERERREKPAGLRTLVLVCLGSAVFTMCSLSFATDRGDAGRVAAQIVTGIGFLGGGVILRESAGVTGTTTAAAIWITAAMGMVVGVGYPAAGIGLAALIRTTLTLLHLVEEHRVARLPSTAAVLVFDPARGMTAIRVEQLLVEFDARYTMRAAEPDAEGLSRVHLTFRLPGRHSHELLAQLAGLQGMHEVRLHSAAH